MPAIVYQFPPLKSCDTTTSALADCSMVRGCMSITLNTIYTVFAYNTLFGQLAVGSYIFYLGSAIKND